MYFTKLVVAADKKFVDEKPETAKKFIRALKEAQEFVKNNPEEARAIVTKRTGFDKEIIGGIWKDFRFDVGISGQLLKNLQMEKEWAVETGKLKDTGQVDFNSMMRYDIAEAN